MDYFNKEKDFQQLRNLPRSDTNKIKTMKRIQNSNKNRPYSFKYVITSIAVVLLAVIVFSPYFYSSEQQINTAHKSSELILSNLKVGMSEDEVKELLGEYYVTGESMVSFDGVPIWRYEIEKSGDYTYAVEGPTHYEFLAFEKMIQGNIQMILFIHWNEQHLVKQFSANYYDERTANIYDVRVLADGTTVKQSIFPTEQKNTQNIFVDMSLVKEKLQIGMGMDEVKEILGDHYVTEIEVSMGTLRWNYDFGKDEDFQFFDELGFGQLEDMKQGKIQAHISIEWDVNNLAKQYYAVYFNEEDHKVYEYGLYKDGYSKDNPIN